MSFSLSPIMSAVIKTVRGNARDYGHEVGNILYGRRLDAICCDLVFEILLIRGKEVVVREIINGKHFGPRIRGLATYLDGVVFESHARAFSTMAELNNLLREEQN